MLNGVEACAHLRILDRTIVLEVLHNRARDLELGDAVVIPSREAVLETVESPSDLVELSGFMRRCVGREIAGKQLACIRDRQHCASLRWASVSLADAPRCRLAALL